MNFIRISCGVNMAHGVFFVAILLSTLVTSLQQEVTQNTKEDYDNDYYDDPESIINSEGIDDTEDTTSIPVKHLRGTKQVNITGIPIINVERDRKKLTTEKKNAKYEVTELVEDVPDVKSQRIPIITNFTLTRPLNFAGVPSNKTFDIRPDFEDEGDEIINSILIFDKPQDNKNNQGKNDEGGSDIFDGNQGDDYFNTFNPKHNFDDEFDKEFGSNEEEFDDFEGKVETQPSKGFKGHFHNFKKTIVNEFKSVINKHKDGIHDSLRRIVDGPVSFFNKLHRKSSDLAKKLHNAVSRHKYHDVQHHDIDHELEESY